MVDAFNTLLYIFLNVGMVFLIFVLIYTFIGTIYNLVIGNKKKEQEIAKAKEELIKSLEELAIELEKCSCENCEKETKKTKKKSTKKESE